MNVWPSWPLRASWPTVWEPYRPFTRPSIPSRNTGQPSWPAPGRAPGAYSAPGLFKPRGCSSRVLLPAAVCQARASSVPGLLSSPQNDDGIKTNPPLSGESVRNTTEPGPPDPPRPGSREISQTSVTARNHYYFRSGSPWDPKEARKTGNTTFEHFLQESWKDLYRGAFLDNNIQVRSGPISRYRIPRLKVDLPRNRSEVPSGDLDLPYIRHQIVRQGPPDHFRAWPHDQGPEMDCLDDPPRSLPGPLCGFVGGAQQGMPRTRHTRHTPHVHPKVNSPGTCVISVRGQASAPKG